MKRKMSVLTSGLFLGMALFCMTGCGSSAKDLLETSSEKLKSISSVEQESEVGAACTLENVDDTFKSPKFLVKIQTMGDMVNDPAGKHIYGSYVQNVFGDKSTEELNIYEVNEKGKEMEYLLSGNDWILTTAEAQPEDVTGNLLSILARAGSPEKQQESGMVRDKETIVITGKLKGDDLKEYISSLSVLDVLVDEEATQWEKASASVTVELYKDTMLPASVKVRSKTLMNAIMKDTVESFGAKIAKSKFSYDCTYKLYDTMTEIVVPKDVKKAAVNYDADEEVFEDAGEEPLDEDALDISDEDNSEYDAGNSGTSANENGDYMISDMSGEHTASIRVPKGLTYTSGDASTLTLTSQDGSYTVKYELQSGTTASMEESYVTDETWFTEENGYENILFTPVKGMTAGDHQIRFCSVNYDYEDAYSIRTIYGWQEFTKDCTCLITVNEITGKGEPLHTSRSVLKKVFENITFD